MGIVADTPDKMIQLIGNVKKNLPLSKLCEGKPSKNHNIYILIIYKF